MTPTQDPFLGTWELDASTLDYQYGRPGRRALYTIEAVGEGLNFTLDADDADGKRINISYGGPLGGHEQPLPGTDAFLVLTREKSNVIESVLKRGGKVIDRWTREVLPDLKSMKIVQHGVTPEGKEFQNTGIYRRVKST